MYKIRTITLIILVVFLFTACGEKPQNAKSESSKTEQKKNNPQKKFPVKVDSIRKENLDREIEYTADLSAFEEVYFAPASPGRIEKIYVEVGDRVKKGDLIAQMDRTQFMLAHEQYQTAKSNFERMDTLYSLKSISEQQYEIAKTQYEVTKASVDFQKKNTTLKSPINGIVTGKYYESGEMFMGAPNTKAGKAAVVTLMQINPLKAFINVPEKYFTEVKKGMRTKLLIDVFPSKEFSGEVFRVHPIIESETRTFQVEIKVKNPREVLRPGMFARVKLNLGETKGLMAPVNAVLMQQGTNNRYIFTLKDDTVARKINVEIAERVGGKVKIVSKEIKEGDPIIIAGQEKLIDSSFVNIVQ